MWKHVTLLMFRLTTGIALSWVTYDCGSALSINRKTTLALRNCWFGEWISQRIIYWETDGIAKLYTTASYIQPKVQATLLLWKYYSLNWNLQFIPVWHNMGSKLWRFRYCKAVGGKENSSRRGVTLTCGWMKVSLQITLSFQVLRSSSWFCSVWKDKWFDNRPHIAYI